jgi:excisionase family DNA binding protein
VNLEEQRGLSAQDVAMLLGIGDSKAYELMNSKDFPSIKIGRRIVVMSDDFLKWKNKKLEEKQNG